MSRVPILLLTLVAACAGDGADDAWHVHPGEEIQPALDAAADHPRRKTVLVHEGVYRPSSPGQALIWLNARHDGIRLAAVGDVELTAANPELADPSDRGYPAIVNHVVYFGDGISRATVLEGFRITGANGFVTRKDDRGPIQPPIDAEIPQGLFFYLDGGGIKIWGRSYPTIENVVLHDNATRLCAGAVSVQHEGLRGAQSVLFRDCEFRDNRCPATGVAIDLLSGSSAVVENCLFVGNVGNTGMDAVAERYGLRWNERHGSGALTVFPGSRVEVRRSTFTGNWNGADDWGRDSVWEKSIFWRNTAGDGSRPGRPYELDVTSASRVRGCYLNGEIVDLQGTIDPGANELNAPDPEFDAAFRPRRSDYADVGYRPVARDRAPLRGGVR